MASTGYSKWLTMQPIMRRAFAIQNERLVQRSPMPSLFARETSDSDKEEFDGVGGLGLMKEYNGSIEYDVFGKYPKTTIEFPEYVQGLAVPRKLIDDDKTGSIQRQFTQLGAAAARTMDSHAASVFNNAFSASYLGADGKALCATDHPLSDDNETTQSNAGTSALNYTSVVDTMKTMMEFTDDRGEPLGLQPNILLVPLALADEATVILNSLNRPGTADNDLNYLNTVPMQLIVWQRLDSDKWFMLDSEMTQMHNFWIDRVPVDIQFDPQAEYNLEYKARSYARWGYGWDYPFFIYGHDT